ncbi:SixA phosphatase family protein [Solirubrum puertoriconensis]|uniref:Phosphohistidine phosphatase n=1 Tax=Solirubrum puertoriconensis TaxID=1751427 RepID=A0A9X0HLI6_SOLP1|nr:histidine phosphatase family protein [Solirubrum puertoriconensis]KUG08126.1 phosphohistidine phosphatase [Solirubrum puertoriconensis]
MKTLYLMRHAKSSWNFDGLSDKERPLNSRGRADAPHMGQALASRNIQPDLLVSSPAVRALSTAALVAKELNYPPDSIQVIPGIYEADAERLFDIITELPDEASSVLLVGHNPTLTDTVNMLSTRSLNDMPTAAVVCLHFHADQWAQVHRANSEFYFYDYPKNHHDE